MLALLVSHGATLHAENCYGQTAAGITLGMMQSRYDTRRNTKSQEMRQLLIAYQRNPDLLQVRKALTFEETPIEYDAPEIFNAYRVTCVPPSIRMSNFSEFSFITDVV